MANKRIQVSDDNGVTFVTLPGNTGDLTDEMGNVVDTIFGQSFESQQPTLGQWGVTANGLYKGVAGHNAVIKKSGTPIAMTSEAMSLVSGKTYQITAAARRVISFLNPVTVLAGGTDVTANVESIDYLVGRVTFKATYTPASPVTITGFYIPMTQIAKGRSFNLSQTVAEQDTTGYDDAQANNGYRRFDEGLRSVSLELGGIFAASSAWRTALTTRALIYVSVDLDFSNPGKTMFHGFFKAMSTGQSGAQGDVETATQTLQLWVPDGDLVARPFGWDIAPDSTLNSALKKCIAAFQAQTGLTVRYLPNGAIGQTPLDGVVGNAILTDISLANAIDGQNEFSLSFRGDGPATAV